MVAELRRDPYVGPAELVFFKGGVIGPLFSLTFRQALLFRSGTASAVFERVS